jgi:hypothetical protein
MEESPNDITIANKSSSSKVATYLVLKLFSAIL